MMLLPMAFALISLKISDDHALLTVLVTLSLSEVNAMLNCILKVGLLWVNVSERKDASHKTKPRP
jgi:hypothetical protein